MYFSTKWICISDLNLFRPLRWTREQKCCSFRHWWLIGQTKEVNKSWSSAKTLSARISLTSVSNKGQCTAKHSPHPYNCGDVCKSLNSESPRWWNNPVLSQVSFCQMKASERCKVTHAELTPWFNLPLNVYSLLCRSSSIVKWDRKKPLWLILSAWLRSFQVLTVNFISHTAQTWCKVSSDKTKMM